MAGEGAVALAADVATHSRVHFHVLLQGSLRLEPLPAQQAEDGHVSTWGERQKFSSATFAADSSGMLPLLQTGRWVRWATALKHFGHSFLLAIALSRQHALERSTIQPKETVIGKDRPEQATETD